MFKINCSNVLKFRTLVACQKCCLLFTPTAYIQENFRLEFIMEVNTMNPDQTAPMEQSDLGSYCL